MIELDILCYSTPPTPRACVCVSIKNEIHWLITTTFTFLISIKVSNKFGLIQWRWKKEDIWTKKVIKNCTLSLSHTDTCKHAHAHYPCSYHPQKTAQGNRIAKRESRVHTFMRLHTHTWYVYTHISYVYTHLSYVFTHTILLYTHMIRLLTHNTSIHTHIRLHTRYVCTHTSYVFTHLSAFTPSPAHSLETVKPTLPHTHSHD